MTHRVLARPEHNVSRKDIDADALKVLYRLKNQGHTAYMVGGGVRDLLLGRVPKDFDIGTSAHPQQVKKLFRNCFIVGRRFRLCHIRFGRKLVEVSTFRRQAHAAEGDDPIIRRDNTFGTPEEDAFRRDFTVNALFYDIANFSVIDYVNGLEDLGHRVIRTIGDPNVRFQEDPVRMLRAIALASRLGFSIEADTQEAIRVLRSEIMKASPPRLLEELYKVLRQGAARLTFEKLHETGLLAYLLPAADRALEHDGHALLGSLDRLDAYRKAGASPDDMTNPLLVATLLVPLGLSPRQAGAGVPRRRASRPEEQGAERPDDVAAEAALLGVSEEPEVPSDDEPVGLPFARRDLDRVRLILLAQRRLRDLESGRSPRPLIERAYFEEALRWLEIHGGESAHALADEWRHVATTAPPADEAAPAPAPERRRRRRGPRRRRPRGAPGGGA